MVTPSPSPVTEASPKTNAKTWLSPFLAVTFLVTSVTGVLLLLHIRNHTLGFLHEWIGLAFVIAGLVHLALHLRTFSFHFKRRAAWAGIAFGLILCLALMALARSAPHHHSDRAGARHGPPSDQGGDPALPRPPDSAVR